ncbi:hypothetical protein DS837_26395 [Azospirillum brasilense]|uniref:Uncharacterized protein n=1 Tax=Azospirillum brasilense TaxID=192 RepID=A0A6L3ATI5_AZOBR|nr:hypothetical protein DS837_26395 [Azospirillum brasilense]
MLLSACTTDTMIHPGMQEGRMAGLLRELTGRATRMNAALAVCPRRQPDHADRAMHRRRPAGHRQSGPLSLEPARACRRPPFCRRAQVGVIGRRHLGTEVNLIPF